MSGHELAAYDSAAASLADEDGGFGVDWIAFAKLAAALFVLAVLWRWRQ